MAYACLAPVAGCATTRRSETSYDPGPYSVGSDHLIFDADGVACVIDPFEHEVLGTENDGTVTAEFASFGTDAGQLNHPVDAVLDKKGRLYVLDRGNDRMHIFDPDGSHQATVGSHGRAIGEMHLPHDIARHGDRLYICDTLNHRVQILDLSGRFIGTIGGEFGEARLNGPRGVAIATNGDLHIVSSGDASVRVFSADGRLLNTYGAYGEEPGGMLQPRSIAGTTDERMFITDPSAGFVHVFQEDGDFLGRFRPVDARGNVVAPMRITVKPNGELYIWTAGHVGYPALGA